MMKKKVLSPPLSALLIYLITSKPFIRIPLFFYLSFLPRLIYFSRFLLLYPSFRFFTPSSLTLFSFPCISYPNIPKAFINFLLIFVSSWLSERIYFSYLALFYFLYSSFLFCFLSPTLYLLTLMSSNLYTFPSIIRFIHTFFKLIYFFTAFLTLPLHIVSSSLTLSSSWP